MTQPAVSQQITSLERSLGVALFERTNRGLELTPAGVSLAAQARPHMSALELLLAEISSSTTRDTQSLTLRYRGSADDAIITPLIREMTRRAPQVSVRLERYKSGESKLRGLSEGTADASLFMALPQGVPDGCRFVSLARARLMVVVSRESDLASSRSLTLDDLLEQPVNLTEDIDAHVLLSTPHGELRYQGLQNELRQRHKRPELLRFVPDTQCALTFTRAGTGVSLIDSSGIRDTSGVIAIPLEPARMSRYGLYYGEDNDNPALHALVECATGLFSDEPFFAPGGKLASEAEELQ